MAQFFKSRRVERPVVSDGKPAIFGVFALDDQGRGVARSADGAVCFIEGALPQETVAAVATPAAKAQVATLKQIVNAAPGRVEPSCPWYARCGGCRLQHAGIEAQREAKQALLLHQLRQLGQVSPDQVDPPLVAAAWHYRRRARLALRFERDGFHLGFRQAASQAICDIDDCAVLLPALAQGLPALRRILGAHARSGDFGHVELIAADEGVIWLLRRLRPLAAARLAALVAALPAGILLLFEDNDGVVRDCQGAPAAPLHYSLALEGDESAFRIAFQAHHFIQVNGAVNDLLIARALAYLDLKPGQKVADLFCGGGNFSLALARRGASVVGVEGVPAMVQQAADNAQQASLAARFLLGDLAQGLPRELLAEGPFAAVILDPSREGARAIVADLAKLGARRAVYVSCNPATLARDARCLVDGGWRLSRVAMVDMFPQTHHLEAIALFESTE